MTLDEAIKHAEEVAEEKEKEAKEWHENQVRKCKLIPFSEMDYTCENECKQCAEEHRQLAEWLKELKRLKEQEPCDNEDIVKAFQFGLAFGFGEKYDEMNKVIDEIQKMQELEQAEIQKAYELGKTSQSKIGKWVLSGGYWRCSECNEKALLKFDNFGIRTPVYIPVKSNFCPNCGLKMERTESLNTILGEMR